MQNFLIKQTFNQLSFYPKCEGLQIQAEVDALAEQCVPAYIRYGRCDAVWQEKRRILKDVYDMDWKTPQEMNPNWDFI